MSHLHPTELSKEKKQLLEKAELYHKELIEARNSIGDKVSKNAIKWVSISIGAVLLLKVLKSIINDEDETDEASGKTFAAKNFKAKQKTSDSSRIPGVIDMLIKPFLLEMGQRVLTNLFVNKDDGDTKEN